MHNESQKCYYHGMVQKSYGGDQGLWKNKKGYAALAKYGCGTVVMCDAELILARDKDFPENVTTDAYMRYVEEAFISRYPIRQSPIPALRGLTPMQMRLGLDKRFNGRYRTKWAYARKNEVAFLIEVKRMLSENLPVVCSYFSFTGKGLPLYDTADAPSPCSYVNNHYMRIFGMSDDEKFFSLISWGRLYYAPVSCFLDKLGLFTNILSVWDTQSSFDSC